MPVLENERIFLRLQETFVESMGKVHGEAIVK